MVRRAMIQGAWQQSTARAARRTRRPGADADDDDAPPLGGKGTDND